MCEAHRRAVEDGSRTVAEAEDDPHANRHQRDQLHDRLDGDRRDDAMVALVHVNIADAEDDRERAQARRHPEGGRVVRFEIGVGRRHRTGGKGHHLEAGGQRLQLQGDVGSCRNQGDDGDQRAECRILAEPRRDQVGDRRGVVDSADGHQLPEEYPPADEHEGWPEIYGHELQPRARSRSDRAEERPARTVDRDRQRVDERRRQPAAGIAAGAAVPGEGDREEDRDIGEAREDNDVGGKHQRRRSDCRSVSAMSVSVSRRAIIQAHRMTTAQAANR